MKYPKTGSEVYVSLNLSNTMLTGIGKGTITREEVSASYLKRLFAEHGVIWQMAELGKVDAGGGGTVAMYISKHNVATVDLGVPVISMHAPYEVVSKGDVYSTYEAFLAFLA